jgi:hypothetical protein
MPSPALKPMHAFMPPDLTPPDDVGRPASGSGEANVVDPEVLAERRAQRAEHAEQSAARRAADAQVLAATLARERARLEAERDAARSEAAAAREGADVVIAEAGHLQAERDALRSALEETRAERDAAQAALVRGGPSTASKEAPEGGSAAAPSALEDPAGPREVSPSDSEHPIGPREASPAAARNGVAVDGVAAPPVAWPIALRRELAVARTAAPSAARPAIERAPAAPVPGLARERRLVAARTGDLPPAGVRYAQLLRRGERATPITALTLERERSNRLQAQLDEALAVQAALRTQVAALELAVRERVAAERRIETALRHLREELTAASMLAGERGAAAPASVAANDARGIGDDTPPARPEAAVAAPPGMAPPPPDPEPPAPAAARPVATPGSDLPAVTSAPPVAEISAAAAAPSVMALDAGRLNAARERLRAVALEAPVPKGPAMPWLARALHQLTPQEPETVGRIAAGLLPAQAFAAHHWLHYDLELQGHGTIAVDVTVSGPTVQTRAASRLRGEADLRIATDHAGLARLLYGRRGLRRRARVRGRRRHLRGLRSAARAPISLRDLAAAGVVLEPALALRLVALAIDPAMTTGHRITIAHAPLGGGRPGAWLQIADGIPPRILDEAPGEAASVTLRCTRGALLPLVVGVTPPPGEGGGVDGDDSALALLRGWIDRTEHPVG